MRNDDMAELQKMLAAAEPSQIGDLLSKLIDLTKNG